MTMARIRTIKPEFFKHAELFDAEVQSGMPLRVAFAGLWCQCDREGRFRWKPRELKSDVLPHDDLDFSRVLHALVTRGFVVPYEVDGKLYGHIPSWHRHQVINNRETTSELPKPTQQAIDAAKKSDAWNTRDGRVTDACGTRHGNAQGEREREGERESESSSSTVSVAAPASAGPPAAAAEPKIDFQEISEACHAALPAEVSWRVKASEDIAPIVALIRGGADLALDVVPAIRSAAERAKADGKSVTSWRFFAGAITDRMNARKAAAPSLAGMIRPDPIGGPDAEAKQRRLAKHYANNRRDWTGEWGPAPGRPGCGISRHILEEFGIDPDTGNLVRPADRRTTEAARG